MKHSKLLVVSAHAADFVWRAGGTIAKYINAGAQVDLVVLSYGARGESNDLWQKPGQTMESVKAVRRSEAAAAAKILGIEEPDFWDLEDYPLMCSPELEQRLLTKIRSASPEVILTHGKQDILNPDHNSVSDLTFRCSIMANSSGVLTQGQVATRQMKLFGFEPHQTELSGYKPDWFIDITDTYEQKVAAMQCYQTQGHLIEYYKQRAFMRGNHARRLSGNNAYSYAESFSSFFPVVAEEFL